jgi:hypothetical protein
MGSNPIPRAILGDLYENGYIKKNTRCHVKNTGLSHNQVNSINNQTPGEKETNQKDLRAPINIKTDPITKSCSKPYFNTILKKLAEKKKAVKKTTGLTING